MRLFSAELHGHIYFFGLCLLAIGMPLSNLLMSISMFILAGNWLAGGDIKEKFIAFWQNKSALLISSIWLIFLIGLLWTENLSAGLNDLRLKLPILILPLIISTSTRLTQRQFQNLMCVFIVTITSVSLYGIFSLIIEPQSTNIRNIMPISRTRFSLMACVAIFALAYLIFKSEHRLWLKIASLLLVIWLIYFLFLMKSITGIVLLVTVAFALLVYWAVKMENRLLKFASVAGLAAIPIILFFYINHHTTQFHRVNHIDLTHLEISSENGEKYYHNVKNKQVENGNFVWIYLAEKELKKTWNTRSNFDYKGNDLKGQELRMTLWRFLTSKGLRKDKSGLSQLTEKEIIAIENGIANYRYMGKDNFEIRVEKIIWEFDNYRRRGNPEGNSVTQRLEFWKTTLGVIKKNPLIGVGTGDLQNELDIEYEKIGVMSKKYWLKPHNEYLSIAVTTGLAGLLFFLTCLFVPAFLSGKMFDYFYATFFIIALLCMLTEDTLGTQAGVTFFTFFSCVFLFARED